MASRDHEAAHFGGDVSGRPVGRSMFLRQASRRVGLLTASLIGGLLFGLAYRALIDTDPPYWANYVRSGLHGVGIGLTAWTVQTAFAAGARSRFGAALRRLPLAGEILVRAIVTTAALVIAGVSLQLLIYVEPYRLYWLSRNWLTVVLPRIVGMGFAISLVFGAVTEIRRLIGGELLASVLLGTYHRPVRRKLIVMFLDLANSTHLAESMGELRVHDLITQFFFDIDEPIDDFGGKVHAYVGDEVIVSWPVTGDCARDARCVACFFAIERKFEGLASDYEVEFGIAPTFRAGLHTGPVVVSECGDAKRQLAYFGDTMNVAARLCDHCKAIDAPLVVSGDLMRIMTLTDEFQALAAERIQLRGRQAPTEVLAIKEREAGPQ